MPSMILAYQSMAAVFFRVTTSVLLLTLLAAAPLVAQSSDPLSAYYQSATGNGATLASQLHDIIDDHTVFSYNSARSNLQIIDADPNQTGRIILAYTNESLDLSPLSSNSIPGWDSGRSWNREHTFPRSRNVGSSGPDNTDLHLLRPADPGVNSSRSNLNFGGEFGLGLPGRVDDGNGIVWYPGDDDAGLIARQQFYADVRYDGSDSSTDDLVIVAGNPPSGTPQLGDLNRLIEWHYADAVDDFEASRNDAVESFQGNRNPFIDRPEYVWSVFVGQANDSRIELAGGSTNGNGGSTLNLDQRVIVGSGSPTNHSVTLNKSGLDGTYYSVTPTGAATSEIDGRLNAFQTNQTDNETFEVGLNASTASVGITSGSITIDNLDVTNDGGLGRGGNDADDMINLSLTVLDHAQPSLAATPGVLSLDLDLGDFFAGSRFTPSANIDLFNLASEVGNELTARLDLDSVTEFDSDNKFTFSNDLFTNLEPGASALLSFEGLSDSLGVFSANYDLLVSDEDIAGEAQTTLELSLSFDVVAELGDFSISGSVGDEDINFFTGQLGQAVDLDSELRELDLDGDGIITLDDHDLHVTSLVETSLGTRGTLVGDLNLDGSVNVLDDAFILISNLGNSDGLGYASGDLNADGTVDVLNDAFRLIENLGQFSGSSFAAAPTTSAVPEPTGSWLLAMTMIAISGRRKRTT
jgi:endonuclease I